MSLRFNRASCLPGYATGQAICPVTQPGKLFARLRNRTVEIHRLHIRTPGYATGQVTHPCGTFISVNILCMVMCLMYLSIALIMQWWV